jgi:hypothetical protein
MGLFSSLFGGKKTDAPKAEKPAAKPAAGKPVVVAAAEPVPVSGSGAMQVKLRLKLASSLRAGELEAAYQAAKSLADIQTKAGRRVAARIWSEQANRILSETETAA